MLDHIAVKHMRFCILCRVTEKMSCDGHGDDPRWRSAQCKNMNGATGDYHVSVVLDRY
jgi:hypothetical protein